MLENLTFIVDIISGEWRVLEKLIRPIGCHYQKHRRRNERTDYVFQACIQTASQRFTNSQYCVGSSKRMDKMTTRKTPPKPRKKPVQPQPELAFELPGWVKVLLAFILIEAGIAGFIWLLTLI
jgi:hypothetical protein